MMNGIKYAEWASHYDPLKKELSCLERNGISFQEKRVLEVGCGTGRFTRRILENCREVVSIDPDEKALAVLESSIHDSRLRVYRGTLETIELEINSFDYVVFPCSMYLIPDKIKNLKIAFKLLTTNGGLIILQANSGEYEEEVAKLYKSYNPLNAYQTAYDCLEDLVRQVFGNVTSDTLETEFLFSSADEVVDNSLFFVEDEEGSTPDSASILRFKDSIKKYMLPNGQFRLTDIVSVFLARKDDCHCVI